MQDTRLSALAAPPPWAERFRSDDLDEVREWVARVDGEHWRVAHRAGSLGFELARLRGTAVALGWGCVGVDKSVRAASRNVLLHLQTVPGSSYRFGHREHLSGADTAMLIAPGQAFTRRSPPGPALALAVDATTLAAEFAARAPGDGGESLLRSGPLAPGAHGGAALVPALAAFVQAHAPGADRAALPHAEAELVAALTDLLQQHEAVVRPKPVGGMRLGRVEDWIEAHLDEPITLGRLCTVAGVGARALMKIFESRRGMPPMRFVAERRLATAHARLLSAAPREVADVATSVGFTHLGRFAIAYRQVFGESPSQTLRRRPRVHAAGAPMRT